LQLELARSPWPVDRWTVEARRVTPAPRDRCRARFLAGEQVLEADRVVPGGELEYPVEDHAAAGRAAPVEPEDELVRVGGQVRRVGRSPVGAQQQREGTIQLLTYKESQCLFGSAKPSSADFDAADKAALSGSVTGGRWTGRAVVLWADDKPSEIAFWGYSGD
jgi:hypothetical protein